MYPTEGLLKFVSPELVFGNRARLLASRYAKNLGAKKVFIVTDPGIIKTGLVSELSEFLTNENKEYEIFSDLTVNPKDYEIMDGADKFLESQSNFIIALGGGSVLDCAKGIAMVATNKKHILDFVGVDKVDVPLPPLVCIPTTAGSGADISQFAVVSDTVNNLKKVIVSKSIIPDVSLIDPSTTLTADYDLTLVSGIDAAVHVAESYVSNASASFTDLIALDTLKSIGQYLPNALYDPGNLFYRSKVMAAATQAGLCFSNTGLGLVHAMAHVVGGFYDLVHGEINAALFPYVLEYNFDAEPKKYLKIAEAFDLKFHNLAFSEQKDVIVEYFINLKAELGLKDGIKRLGVKEKDIPQMAPYVMHDPCIVTNPRKPTVSDIEEVLYNAL